MSNLDTQNINVLSYNMNDVFVNASKDHYYFKASRDGKTPSVVPMPLSDLQYINSNTNVFIIGLLTFDDDVKEEVYKELRIKDWKKILSDAEIENIIKNPTVEGLQKIVDIDNVSYFDRVRVVMFRLLNGGTDITTKVKSVIDTRFEELQNRKRVSSIRLVEKDIKSYATPDDVNTLKSQNESLQTQLDEMKKMMEQMMSMQTEKKETSNTAEKKTTTAKKPGRPKKTVTE